VTGMDRDKYKRAPKEFEPPPWEREAFEEFARRRASETENPLQAPMTAPEKPAVKAVLDEQMVDGMLVQLGMQQHEDVSASVWKVGIGAAVLLFLMGTWAALFSVVALSKTFKEGGMLALLSSSLVGMIGLGMLGLGVWLGVRSYNKRGEL